MDHGTRCEFKHYDTYFLIKIAHRSRFVQHKVLKVTPIKSINVFWSIHSNFPLIKKYHNLLELNGTLNITLKVLAVWKYGNLDISTSAQLLQDEYTLKNARYGTSNANWEDWQTCCGAWLEWSRFRFFIRAEYSNFLWPVLKKTLIFRLRVNFSNFWCADHVLCEILSSSLRVHISDAKIRTLSGGPLGCNFIWARLLPYHWKKTSVREKEEEYIVENNYRCDRVWQHQLFSEFSIDEVV